jgi:MFS family permease
LFVAVGVVPAFVGDLHSLLLTRFPVGIAEAGIISTQNALLGDYFKGRERERWLGRMSLINPIVAALLVLAGGALGTFGWRAPFLLYLLGVPLLVWTLVSLHEPERDGPELPASAAVVCVFPRRQVLLVGAVTLAISVFYYVQAVQLGRMFAEHDIGSPAAISLFVTLSSAGVVLGGWAYPRLAKFADHKLFALILLAYAVGYVGLGLASSAVGSLPAALIAQFGNGMAIPVMIGWSLQHFDDRHRGTCMGTWAAGFFAGTSSARP